MNASLSSPQFGFGLTFEGLYRPDGLSAIDTAFLGELQKTDAALAERLAMARATPAEVSPADESALIIALAPHLEDFIGTLFGIESALLAAKARQDGLAPLYEVKRQFVQRRALKEVKPEEAATLDGAALEAQLTSLIGGAFDELTFSKAVLGWLADAEAHAEPLTVAARWAAWKAQDVKRHAHSHTVLFKIPEKRDPLALVPVRSVEIPGGVTAYDFPPEKQNNRDGFDLTDQGCDLAGALDEINYCILCHHQGKDSCSKGLPDRKQGGTAKSAVGMLLAGCPLEEKISEMHEVRASGVLVGGLAVAVIDNPMVAGTGHRICNDCMAACIYQGQNRDAVDIPQGESRTLKDVLALPWGFEIYGLLTRWNPLNIRRPLPKADSGRKVLVVGLGPAGYTLAHHLMQDGHSVAAIDGLKIEPLSPHLSGVTVTGERVPFSPIRDVQDLWEPLGSRVLYGFGGVAEYGITVRWDKNFLKVIRLLLERRAQFAMFGGIRFGGTLTLDQAVAMGFDHVALATGAGKPTIIDMPGNLAKGVRQASDFLMALQLTGAGRGDTIANLQLRLPVVVIGGGLTAIDSATEALAYYPVQVEKFLARYETLVAEQGERATQAQWSEEDREIAMEFITHGLAIRAERAQAAKEGRAPALRELMDSWGGSTMAYRRRLVESPAYRNSEEVNKAMEEGIRFAERMTPLAVETDRFGAAKGLRVKDGDGVEHVLPARSVIVAAGTVPNTTLAREAGGIHLNGKYYQAVDDVGTRVSPEPKSKPEAVRVLMDVDDNAHRVSFFGDLHPSFAGNVVSAMASAKQGHPAVTQAMTHLPQNGVAADALFAQLNQGLRATVHAVTRLTPTIVEVVVKAPFAARAFEPGQFYRLQNFEALAPVKDGTVLAMEGLALTGAWTDPDAGLVGLIVLEMGGSSNLVAKLTEGESVVVMGPTGAPTEIPAGETVLLAGGGLGNAVLFSIGRAFRAAGSKVLYFAGYREARDRFKIEDIEAAADVVVWCVDKGDAFAPNRPQDRAFVGNIVEAIKSYGEGRMGVPSIALNTVDRIIAIGSDRMMSALGKARHGVLEPMLKPHHHAIASINSPMQCMMKEICAQCLQRHRDPKTGEEMVVFTCFNQDQELDNVDFANLADRLSQNSLSEKVTAQWIARSLAK